MAEHFADQLIRILQKQTEPQHHALRKSLTETMTHPLAIKILVDAKHLEDMFSEPHLSPHELSDLTWPLNEPIYVEPTEPIKPARLQMLEAILRLAIRQAGYDPDPERMWTRALLVLPSGRDRRTLCILNTWSGEVLASTMELTPPTGGADTEMMGMNQPEQADEALRQYDIATGLQFFGNATTRLLADISRMGVMPELEPIPKQQRMSDSTATGRSETAHKLARIIYSRSRLPRTRRPAGHYRPSVRLAGHRPRRPRLAVDILPPRLPSPPHRQKPGQADPPRT